MRRKTIRQMIVLVELLVLVAAVMVWREKPAVDIVPETAVTIPREYHYRIFKDEAGIYLQPDGLLSLLGSIQLIRFQSRDCHVYVRLDDDITLNGDIRYSASDLFEFTASDLRISGDKAWRAILEFDDSKLEFLTSCDFASTDGG